RRDIAKKFQLLFLVRDALENTLIRIENLEIDGCLETPINFFGIEDGSLLAPVEEIGRRKETGHGLDAAGDELYAIFGLGCAGRASRADHKRQVPTGRSARNANAIWVDVIILGMIADIADGAMNILDDFGDGKLWLRAVNHGEYGVAVLEERLVHFRAYEDRMRTPTAADDEDDAKSITLLLGSEYVHRQGKAGLAAINYVAGTQVGRNALGTDRDGRKQNDQVTEKKEVQLFAHDDPQNRKGAKAADDTFKVTSLNIACKGLRFCIRSDLLE